MNRYEIGFIDVDSQQTKRIYEALNAADALTIAQYDATKGTSYRSDGPFGKVKPVQSCHVSSIRCLPAADVPTEQASP